VARSARRAVLDAREKGIKAGLLHLVTLYPFPRRDVVATITDAKVVLVPEMNMGQISREVKRVNEGVSRVATLNRIDGGMISPQEIYEWLLKEA
jgi:2-oxoglutarate ferredoxin oxidoreductase subunit alpha